MLQHERVETSAGDPTEPLRDALVHVRDASAPFDLPARLGAVAVFLLHTLLTLHFQRPEAFFSDRALQGGDFDTHFGQVTRFIDAMQGWGRTWSYDPSLLAGRPAGVLFDCDTKAWELWTYALHLAGLSRERAFNVFVVAACLAVPAVALAAARLLRLSMRASVLVALLASMLWFFDSQTHYFWWIGMITWAFGSVLALLPLGLFYRYVGRPRLLTALLAGLALGLTLLVHPFTFFVLVVPMLLVYRGGHAWMSPGARWGVWAVAAIAIAINAFWLGPALRFHDAFLESPFYSQAGLETLGYDFMALAVDPNDTGLFMRTGLRFLVLAAGAAGLARWLRDRDARARPFVAAVVVLLAESYLGSYTPLTAQIQPYRFIVPATFLMTLPAVAYALDSRTRRAVRNARGPVLVLALAAVQLVAHDALYFFPDAVPAQVSLGAAPDPASLTPTGYPRQGERRHPLPSPGGDLTVRWFRAHPPAGRVLVEPNVLGERLATLVPGIEVMGGIRERSVVHTLSNFFRLYPDRDAPPEELARYLARYGVEYVVLGTERPFPEQYASLLRPVAVLPEVRITRVAASTSRVVDGPGRVRARMNRIEVADSDPNRPVVLRYHYVQTLVCEPDCTVARAPEPGDPVGFLRVEAPHPRDFVVRNAY